MDAFDLINTPLTGTKLIEASAGTGKTYTIAGLFVRLILEMRFKAEQILVVTYTKAATEELRGRIYRKLIQTRNGFDTGASEDSFVEKLIQQSTDRDEALRLIKDAIIDMDRASVFTIHGFCQRVLHENAFETGSLYDTELVPDPTALYLEVAEDFWRTHFYRAAPEFISYLLNQKKIDGPVFFYRLYHQVAAAELEITPNTKQPELKKLDSYRRLYRHVREQWPQIRSEISDLLKTASLKANIYGSFAPDKSTPEFSVRDVRVAAMVATMDRFVGSTAESFPLFKSFEKFTATKVASSVKKDQPVPDHPFLHVCDRLFTVGIDLGVEMDAYLLFLKCDFFKFARSQVDLRKKTSNIQFYDDLLLKVKRVLVAEAETGNQMLAAAIRQKYSAALVDEFQDTDTVQYHIFSQIFQKPPALLFMIGDPKQSIYSFRGADIFSYMDAAAGARSRYTLLKNWRSEPALVEAVNTLFSGVKTPFLFSEIPFEKGTAGGGAPSSTASTEPPLQLWYLPAENDKKINKSKAVAIISDAVADEISRLISTPSDPVRPGDIAVLVRTNRQARIIKESLIDRRVPSVLYGAGSIFETREAAEIQQILTGIIETGDEARFRAALATDIIGISGNDIAVADDTSDRWERHRARFRLYLEQWQRYGILRMFRLLLAREGVRTRLLTFADGDRRLTNVLHLGELLHRESQHETTGMSDLINWLAEQRNPAAPRPEEHPLRLESDASAVKIVTIHKSKGLEYPVVFCPFCWESSLISGKKPFFFHAERPGHPIVLDLGSNRRDKHTVIAQNELLAENLRLLYVAVTRAQRRCYLVWGHINTADTSALAYLFHSPDSFDDKDIVSSLKGHMSRLTGEDRAANLDRLVGRSAETIALSVLSEKNSAVAVPWSDDEVILNCREFSGTIDRAWKLSSYSSLVSYQQRSTDRPDYDTHLQSSRREKAEPSDLLPPDMPARERSIFTFPKGARAGTFFHDILETLDFGDSNPENPDQLVAVKLREYGFDSTWKGIVLKALDHLLRVNLSPGEPAITLNGLSTSARISEMEFYFPVRMFTAAELQAVFKTHDGAGIPAGFARRLERLRISPAGGFIKGYIDMVFEHAGRYYILDWKSNHLGDQPADYDRKSLEHTIAEEFYALQYCLYALAFNRYARTRMPDFRWEKDFGGVFYVFIRGVDADSGSRYGIYHALPDVDLIRDLERTLIA